MDSLKNRTKEIPFLPSTIENVDEAIFKWLDEKLDLYTTTNKGWGKVPIIWVLPERAFLSKRNKNLQDQEGSLILPLITIERESQTKDLSRRGSAVHNIQRMNDIKGGSITIARKINQDKTSNFVNADTYRSTKGKLNFPNSKSNKVVYETITMPMPVYVVLNYKISLKTEYQTQMNDLLTPFLTITDAINYFTIKNNGHSYECFIQSDFSNQNNLSDLSEQEREFETIVHIEVLAHLMGEGKNSAQPKIVKRENAVDIKFPKETIILGPFPSDDD